MKLFTVSLLALCSLWGPSSVKGACMDDETAMFDNDCRTNFRFVDDHDFPNEYSILFDNYDFSTLLSSSSGELRGLDVDEVSTTSQGMVSHCVFIFHA